MRIYGVGGGVRDLLLGQALGERDYCVVGSCPAEMQAHGFVCVGKDFPVFLSPLHKEEYALARTERKTGQGYQGFSFNIDASIRIEDDLYRRDFTINAMAIDMGDNLSLVPEKEWDLEIQRGLIDPYGGQADIAAKLLRHISVHFEEDPLRILRCARFLARFWSQGFRVHETTTTMIRRMVERGECRFLQKERVMVETRKALVTLDPEIYFQSLIDWGAWADLFPQGPLCCSEGLRVLSVYKDVSADPWERLLSFLLGGLWPLGPGHSLDYGHFFPKHIQQLLRVGLESAAVLFEQGDLRSLDDRDQRIESLLNLLYQWDVFRRPERFDILWMIAKSYRPSLNLLCLDTIYQRALGLRWQEEWLESEAGGADRGRLLREKRLALLKMDPSILSG